jgi:hypothetical protein
MSRLVNGRAAGAIMLFLAAGLASCGTEGHRSTDARVIPVAPLPPPATPGAAELTEPSSTELRGPSQPGTALSGSFQRSVYAPQAHGYDASYPQCSAGRVPRAAGFSIVGVNRGKPFTANPCLRREWRSARPRSAVYVNSSFSPRDYSRTTAGCRRLSELLGASGDRRRAYAIGCSEAVYSRAVMLASGIRQRVMWWVDVELANSWDQDDLNLNRFALQGEIDQLAAAGALVGLYSTFYDWDAITGGWSPAGVVADWVAAPTRAMACGRTGFSGAPVWLVQEAAVWPEPSGYDSDWSC